MKVILVMVSTVDGKITKWRDGDSFSWTSKEDQKQFLSVVRTSNLIVMGSKTYDLIKPKPKKGVLRIVMTSDPRRYTALSVPGQLEFTDESPQTLVDRLSGGFRQMFLVGGGAVNTSFFKEGLVDELWLTIEPRIFGKGKMIVSKEELDMKLQLVSFEKLNKQGTLLVKYQVEKPISI